MRTTRSAAALGVGALVAAGVVVPTALATSAAAADRCDLVAPTRGFTVLVRDDASLAGSEVEGTVAIGGAATWQNTFDVRHSTGLTPPDYDLPTLSVGGEDLPVRFAAGSYDLAGSSGTLQVGSEADDAAWPRGYMLAGEETWSSTSLSGDQVFVTDGGTSARVLPPAPPASDAELPQWVADYLGPVDVSSLTSGFPTLEDNAAYLDSLTGTEAGVSEVFLEGGPSEKQLELVEGQVNLLSVTPDAFAGTTAISFTGAVPSEDTVLVIKLKDGAGTQFTVPRFNGANDSGTDNLYAPWVLWNYAASGPLTLVGQDRVTGTILAPSADLVLQNSSPVEGQVIARSLSKPNGTGEIHHYAFLGCSPVVPPTTVATVTASKSLDVVGEFDEVPTDFRVAVWIDDVRQRPDVVLAADGTPVGPVTVPAGSTIEVRELLPPVDGGDWAEPEWTVEGATPATPTHGGDAAFVVEEDAAVEVAVANTLVGQGRFSIEKQVVDEDGVGGTPDDFTFEVWVDGEQTDDLVVPSDGTVVGPVDVGPNAVVELVEVAPTDPDGGEWQEPVLTVTDGDPVAPEHGGFAFEVGQGSAVSAVEATNTLVPVTPEPPLVGGLAITKRVTGEGAVAGTTYSGDWTCDAADADGDDAGRWTLEADETLQLDGFPAGTTCTVTEDDSDDWSVTYAPADGQVVVAAGETVDVVVTNDVPAPDGGDDGDDDGDDTGGELPVTGAEGSGALLGVGVTALLVGTGLLLAARRRRTQDRTSR
ncbi:choice-of-anchor A family protein [Cellulomonas sp. DKR-3]|uniref:Choice-of-anchor A family protein n=1 Tax=Cellulomonas fulva TaxID=2835530 RepID=A0ABS5TYU9_9CELL|nr:collagen-binding domain-containing protein [Cellulomonas fulva]MBT0994338.1 choice-of-anchor A family protein [Cellulomonas fulva]